MVTKTCINYDIHVAVVLLFVNCSELLKCYSSWMGTHPSLTQMENLGNLRYKHIPCIDVVYNGHLHKASRKLQKLSDVLIYCKCEQSCALGLLLVEGHYQLQQNRAQISMDALEFLYKCTVGTQNSIIKVSNCIKLFYHNKVSAAIYHIWCNW